MAMQSAGFSVCCMAVWLSLLLWSAHHQLAVDGQLYHLRDGATLPEDWRERLLEMVLKEKRAAEEAADAPPTHGVGYELMPYFPPTHPPPSSPSNPSPPPTSPSQPPPPTSPPTDPEPPSNPPQMQLPAPSPPPPLVSSSAQPPPPTEPPPYVPSHPQPPAQPPPSLPSQPPPQSPVVLGLRSQPPQPPPSTPPSPVASPPDNPPPDQPPSHPPPPSQPLPPAQPQPPASPPPSRRSPRSPSSPRRPSSPRIPRTPLAPSRAARPPFSPPRLPPSPRPSSPPPRLPPSPRPSSPPPRLPPSPRPSPPPPGLPPSPRPPLPPPRLPPSPRPSPPPTKPRSPPSPARSRVRSPPASPRSPPPLFPGMPPPSPEPPSPDPPPPSLLHPPPPQSPPSPNPPPPPSPNPLPPPPSPPPPPPRPPPPSPNPPPPIPNPSPLAAIADGNSFLEGFEGKSVAARTPRQRSPPPPPPPNLPPPDLPPPPPSPPSLPPPPPPVRRKSPPPPPPPPPPLLPSPPPPQESPPPPRKKSSPPPPPPPPPPNLPPPPPPSPPPPSPPPPGLPPAAPAISPPPPRTIRRAPKPPNNPPPSRPSVPAEPLWPPKAPLPPDFPMAPSFPPPPRAKAPRSPKLVRSPRPPPSPEPPDFPSPPSVEALPDSVIMNWADLPTFKRTTEFLMFTAGKSGGRCTLSSVGKSVQGRDLWLITAGNQDKPTYPDPANPNVSFPKPKVALIGAMHGDEKGNFQILLQYISELCLGSDPRVKNIVDTTTVYIIPTMNPDGYVASNRLNANGVDLNRNCYTSDFPFPRPKAAEVMRGVFYEAAYFLTTGGTSMEPENKAVTQWLSAMRPTVSADLHGGALVAGYTLDACDALGALNWCESPDHPVPAYLANVYGMNHARMYLVKQDTQGMGRFVNGTTQGADWYVAIGTLADWLHHSERLHMLTLELHNKKTPTGSDLAGLYGNNRNALLRFSEVAHLGFRARLLDKLTRAPLRADVLMEKPADIWPPQVEAGGYIWKVGIPGTTYRGTIQPYDLHDLTIRYAPIPFSFIVPSTWEDVVKGSGTSGLSVVQTFFAERL